MPTSYALFWYPVGKATSRDYGAFFNASTNQYKITGLSPSTNYFIRLLAMETDSCGFAFYQTGLVDTLVPSEFHSCMDMQHSNLIFCGLYRRNWFTSLHVQICNEIDVLKVN